MFTKRVLGGGAGPPGVPQPHAYPRQHTAAPLCVVALSSGIIVVFVCRCLGA